MVFFKTIRDTHNQGEKRSAQKGNMTNKRYLISMILSLIISIISLAAATPAISYEWQMSKHDFTAHNSAAEFINFFPDQKSHYRNRIMSYISGIAAGTVHRMEILRNSADAKRDYLFIDNKLYSVMADYGKIPASRFRALFTDLKKQYGKASVKKDKTLSVISFSDKKTKVVMYGLAVENSIIKCKVYYYPAKLFMMMLNF